MIRILDETEYKKSFVLINPTKLVAPFGFFWEIISNEKMLVITTKKYIDCFNPKNFEIKTYENCHAKLAIGTEGAMFGSWNWSLTHETSSKHAELVVFVSPDEPLFSELNLFFAILWTKAHKVQ
jgi:hypothetical protein